MSASGRESGSRANGVSVIDRRARRVVRLGVCQAEKFYLNEVERM